jgi:hypothetical protein
MVDKLDLIHDMVRTQGERMEALGTTVGTVSMHCATLLERTAHMATREDVSQSIATHMAACRASRAPRGIDTVSGDGARRAAVTRLIKALAALFAIAAAAVGAWLGFGGAGGAP